MQQVIRSKMQFPACLIPSLENLYTPTNGKGKQWKVCFFFNLRNEINKSETVSWAVLALNYFSYLINAYARTHTHINIDIDFYLFICYD